MGRCDRRPQRDGGTAPDSAVVLPAAEASSVTTRWVFGKSPRHVCLLSVAVALHKVTAESKYERIRNRSVYGRYIVFALYVFFKSPRSIFSQMLTSATRIRSEVDTHTYKHLLHAVATAPRYELGLYALWQHNPPAVFRRPVSIRLLPSDHTAAGRRLIGRSVGRL